VLKMVAQHRERARRCCAVLLQLADHALDLRTCGRALAVLFALPLQERRQGLLAEHPRYLFLLLRQRQLAAEVRSFLSGAR
jgi:hypothetical protein